MPTYPTGSQNLELLEILKTNYSEYMPGFKGDSNSITDFMRHLSSQGVEGMDVGKENRADLLGLNQPQLAQPLGEINVQADRNPSPLKHEIRRDSGIDFPTDIEPVEREQGLGDLMAGSLETTGMEKLQAGLSEKFMGHQDTWEKNMASSDVAQDKFKKTLSDKFDAWGKKIAPSVKEWSPEGYSGPAQWEKDIGKFGEKKEKERLAGLWGNTTDEEDFDAWMNPSKLSSAAEKLGDMGSKLGDVAGKAMEGFDKYGGGAMMAFQGKAAGDAADKAIDKLQDGMRQMTGMRGEVVRDRDEGIDTAKSVTKASIGAAGLSGNEKLKELQGGATSNIAVGSIKKKASDMRQNLQDSMKQTISLAKTREDAAIGTITSKSRGRFEDIDTAESSIKDALKQAEKAKKMAFADTAVGIASLGVDVFTGGTGGKAIRTGYSAGKKVYNSYG